MFGFFSLVKQIACGNWKEMYASIYPSTKRWHWKALKSFLDIPYCYSSSLEIGTNSHLYSSQMNLACSWTASVFIITVFFIRLNSVFGNNELFRTARSHTVLNNMDGLDFTCRTNDSFSHVYLHLQWEWNWFRGSPI